MEESIKARFESKYAVNPRNGCWEWTAYISGYGYGQFWAYGKNVSAHRFSYELHNGGVPKGLHVLHRCDNRKCANPAHLFLGTNRDNVMDKVAKNRQARHIGSANGMSKLTNIQVVEIRELYALGNYTQRYLGRLFGVGPDHISRIVNNKAREVLICT